MPVTISAVDWGTGMLIVSDKVGNEFEVDGNFRSKGMGFPEVGERWVLSRKGSVWALDSQIGAPAVRTIEGSRDGMHPVSVQVLESLARQGLFYDQTVGAVVQEFDDDNDPPPGDFPADEVEDEPVLEPDEPGVVPPKDSGPKPDDKDNDDDDQSPLWVPVHFGSYNLKFTVGSKRAKADLLRLTKGRVDVLGLQEMGSPSRANLVDWLAGGDTWNAYHPQDAASGESAIVWRQDVFEKVDEGWYLLSTKGDNPGPSRRPTKAVVWVKLRHKRAGRAFVFQSLHLLAHTEGHTNWHAGPYRAGHPSSDPNLNQSMTATFNGIAEVKTRMREWGRNVPVFTVGDFNIDFFADRRVRHPRFPYAQFRSIDTFCNFDLLNHRPRFGTHGKRYIDLLWVTRPIHHLVKVVDHWILTGFASDHKPLLVKVLFKTKGRR
jgi:hypothetical protein